MTKEINLRNTSNKVSSNYISKISEIAGEKVKNIIIEATVIDHKNIEIDKGIVTLLKLKDSSGTIDGMLIGKRDDEHKALVQSIENNNTYKFRGTVVKAEEYVLFRFFRLLGRYIFIIFSIIFNLLFFF